MVARYGLSVYKNSSTLCDKNRSMFLAQADYFTSTITNQFCLEIICCRVRFSFNYLIYPYYPAYTG